MRKFKNVSTLVDKFLQKIEKDLNLDIPLDTTIHRTYAKKHQKSMGSFTSWFQSNSDKKYHSEIGLFESCNKLIKCPNLTTYNVMGTLTVICNCEGRCEGIKTFKEYKEYNR